MIAQAAVAVIVVFSLLPSEAENDPRRSSALRPIVPVPARPVPGTDCLAFPPSNIWNTGIDDRPVHELSERWLRAMDAAATDLHPDFGPPGCGIPFEVVGRRHPMVHVDFQYAEEGDPGPTRSTRPHWSRADRTATR